MPLFVARDALITIEAILVKMDCCNDWSASEDVLTLFYASRGVFPEAIREIMILLCARERHARCIHNRCISLMTKDSNLYNIDERTFDHNRVRVWIDTHDDDLFSPFLVFSKPILQSIKQYQKLEYLEATTPFDKRLEHIKKDNRSSGAEDTWV
ncbi:hypothetical protein LTR78_009337 [Recurvomyces mirabilis]|uniref:Uncharacterized protein n=1 Tax=Recurvomyces mirabilis TaxID=574656 RepID=A0AAE0WIH7_9PEZI|nr:hypothetical protein LTR78_009337 [Recurvomyces mirabilis]